VLHRPHQEFYPTSIIRSGMMDLSSKRTLRV
jgi:hypothetical protein